MAIATVRRANERLEGLRARKAELAREHQRLEADLVKKAGELQADGLSEIKTKSLQRQLQSLQDSRARNRLEFEGIELQLKAADGRLVEAKRHRPKVKAAHAKITALGQEGERTVKLLEKSTGDLLKHVARLRAIGDEIHGERREIGLPARGEAWYPYEQRMHETILGFLWAHIGSGDLKPPHEALAKYVHKDGLQKFFSAWRAYLPGEDDDSELPPAA